VTVANITTSAGPIGYWTLDDGTGTTAADSSGNGNAGTLVNGPTWTTGKIGGALSFNGVNQYVTIPSAAALNAYPLTVAVWMNTSTTTGLQGVVNKYAPGSLNGYQVFLNAGSLCAWYFKDTSNYVWDGTGCTLATPGYANGLWHHVAFVVDASGGSLYVDGVLKATQLWTGVPGATSTAQPLDLAVYPGAAGVPYLSGSLDDVRTYNRALSATEVLGLYNGATNLVWISAVNATASGSSLTKTSGCNGCYDAGAGSQQQIASGNGYAQFTASETATLRVAGLAHAFTGTDPGTIDFGLRLQSGIAEVRENGVYRTDTAFVTGDVFRVTVQSGVASYSKNGTVFYTSTAAPTYPLFFAAALANLNATVSTAVLASGY
jgi:hypothetical protein